MAKLALVLGVLVWLASAAGCGADAPPPVSTRHDGGGDGDGDGDGDEASGRNAASAIPVVEDAKAMAHGNVNPQLIAASVMLDLSRRLS